MTEREKNLLKVVRFIQSEVAGLDVLASKAGKAAESRFFGALADVCTAALRPYDQPFDGRAKQPVSDPPTVTVYGDAWVYGTVGGAKQVDADDRDITWGR